MVCSILPLEGHGSTVWNTLKIGAQLVKRGLIHVREALRLCFGLMLRMETLPSYPFTLIFRLNVILFLLLDGIKWLIIKLLISWVLLLDMDASALKIVLLGAQRWTAEEPSRILASREC